MEDGRTDGQTDGRTEIVWLLQRSALRAMRMRCHKNYTSTSADTFIVIVVEMYMNQQD